MPLEALRLFCGATCDTQKKLKTGNLTTQQIQAIIIIIEDLFEHFSELNSVEEINEGQTKDSPTLNETLTC